jgi:hypothetical protein
MHALQRPTRRLRYRRQADAAPLHRARREAPTDYSATPTAAVRRAVRPGLPIETSDQQVVQAHRPAGACRRAAQVGGPHTAQDPGRCRHQIVRADLRHSRFARWVGGQAPPLQAGRVQVIDFPRMPPQSTQAGATHGSRVSPGHWRLWAFAAVFAAGSLPHASNASIPAYQSATITTRSDPLPICTPIGFFGSATGAVGTCYGAITSRSDPLQPATDLAYMHALRDP